MHREKHGSVFCQGHVYLWVPVLFATTSSILEVCDIEGAEKIDARKVCDEI